jgi:RNA polymerase sigma factor (sigma-70 family)
MAQGATPSILRYLRTLGAKEALKDVSDGELLERFAAEHDEATFAVMVRRHGGMVLHVCRSVLHNHADADDAFQATFLVLARRAPSIRKNGSLGSWLHSVAYRTALKARTANARRKRHETQARAEARHEAMDELTWREAQGIVHQELARLPEKYRAPLVLCYLQGKRQDEAEQELGWPHGKLRSMLERARDLLRKRLLQRGLGPSAVLCLSVGLDQTLTAAPPRALLFGAARAAVSWTTGTPAGAVSAQVASLAEGMVLALSKTKIALAFSGLLAVAALGFGACPEVDLPDSARGNAPVVRVSLPRQGQAGRAAPTRKVKVSARASRVWDQHTPDRAFDGAGDTMWNAGGYAPQWIETDLGAATPLATLALVTCQMPAGHTTHEVWVSDEAIGEDRTRAKLAHTFTGHTDSGQRLTFAFPAGLCARHVQIRTTESPSWIAWAEVELRVQRPDGQYLCWSDRPAGQPQVGSYHPSMLAVGAGVPLPECPGEKVPIRPLQGEGAPWGHAPLPERRGGEPAPPCPIPPAPQMGPSPDRNLVRSLAQKEE